MDRHWKRRDEKKKKVGVARGEATCDVAIQDGVDTSHQSGNNDEE